MNEKKLGAIIVMLIASIVPALMLYGYVANALNQWFPGPYPEAIALGHCSINRNAQSLNVSLTILSCSDKATVINTLKLSNLTQSNSPGISVAINGTYIDCASSPLFTIQAGDTMIVNMIVPYANYPNALSMLRNAGTTSITAFTNQAMYYNECDTSGL